MYSFEFIPSNIEIYKKNVSLNPHLSENIKIIPNPVWETSGKELYYNNSGPGSTVLPHDFKGSAGRIVTTSIDDFVQKENLSKVDFIKMDIQGAEINLLKGAKETIKKFRPVIFTEATSDFLSVNSLYDEISKYEYDVFNIQTNGILSLMLKETIVEGNWLAKPKLSVSNNQDL